MSEWKKIPLLLEGVPEGRGSERNENENQNENEKKIKIYERRIIFNGGKGF